MTDIDLGTIMQQAQALKEKMEYLQKGLAEQTVEGSAGAGMVKVVATGTGRVQSVRIDPAVLEEDREMVEDLVTAAVNQALDNARKLAQETLGSMLPPGMPIPGT